MSAEMFERIRQLISNQPAMPFRDLSSWPYDCRKRPEYIKWVGELQDWSKTMDRLHCEGIAVEAGADRAAVLMHGVPVPGLSLVRQPDGVIVRDLEERNYDSVQTWSWSWRWSWSYMALPGPKQDLRRWAARQAGARSHPRFLWNVHGCVKKFLNARQLKMYRSPAWDARLDEIQIQWAQALRPLVNYKALTQLRRLVNSPRCGQTFAEYNIAAHCGGALQELSRSNPGAVGWWLAIVRKALNDSGSGFLPESLPTHPGEIIAQARDQFRRVGGRSWKSLTRLPVPEIYALTMSHRLNAVAQTVDSLAQLPRDPERPGQRRQPPYEIKEQIAHIYSLLSSYCPPYAVPHGARDRLRASVSAALDRVVSLAVREFAGYAGEPVEISDVVDYAMTEPVAALRRGSWNALSRAAARWHEDLNERDRPNETQRVNLEWSGALTEYEVADFRARLLASGAELRAETDLMRHCVGQSGYDYRCARGELRIFHLEPPGLDAGDESEQRRQATTVALALRNEAWTVVQQRGFGNRGATKNEAAQASRLAQAYNRAEQRKRAPAPGGGKRYERGKVRTDPATAERPAGRAVSGPAPPSQRLSPVSGICPVAKRSGGLARGD